jgi:hypothetical protein
MVDPVAVAFDYILFSIKSVKFQVWLGQTTVADGTTKVPDFHSVCMNLLFARETSAECTPEHNTVPSLVNVGQLM